MVEHTVPRRYTFLAIRTATYQQGWYVRYRFVDFTCTACGALIMTFGDQAIHSPYGTVDRYWPHTPTLPCLCALKGSA